MPHSHIDRAHQRSRRAIAIAIAIVVALGLPLNNATAQIGGLVRKAKDKVVDQQVGKQVEKRTNAAASGGGAAPAFDDVTLELTTDRVAQVLRGLTAGRAVLDGANGSPSRASLIARRDDAARKSAALSDANNKTFDVYYQQRDASQRCRNDAERASSDKRQQANEQKQKEFQAKAMSDPAFRDKAMAIAQKIAMAQQRGDTAEMRRLMTELNGGAGNDPTADSVAADKACGAPPPKPSAMVQVEQLDAQATSLSDQIRKLEERSAATEVTESGLTERQFLMARERIEAYLSAMKYKSQPRGFSPSELEALGARQADLEKAM
jgi:hypothetical protein